MPEGLWDRVRRALKREAQDIEASVDDAVRRGNATLDEKERELNASPEERLRIQQERADDANDAFEELKRKIEGDAT